MKLFGRIDALVEKQIVSQDRKQLIKFEVTGVPDKEREKEELRAIESCAPLKDVYRKIQPKVKNPLYD